MTDMHQLRLPTSWGELRLVGGSRAGEATVVLLPQLRLALDAGRPARAVVPMQHVLVSHGHADHVGGLVAWASQRQLLGLPPGQVLTPAGIAADVAELLAVAARLEGGKPYGVVVRAAAPGDTVDLRPDFALRIIGTSHWVQTIGCIVDWSRRKLRSELAGYDEAAIVTLRAQGEEVTETVVTPLLAYLADTGPETLAELATARASEVIVTECTFLRPEERERAHRFGHTHLDDIVAIAPQLACRHLVLTHLSRRHRLGPASQAIRRALKDRFAGELHLLNSEWE